LAVTHAARVLHRDIKPDNVLLDLTGPIPQPRLSDFGIARLAEGTAVHMSQLIGTPEYLAPEVVSTEVVTSAADIYGTGILLYELMAGRTPFASGGPPYAIIKRQVDAQPPVLEDLPRPLWDVLAQLLAKDPSARPDAVAAAALLRAQRPALAGLAPLPQQETPPEWEPAHRAPEKRSGTIIRGQQSADLEEELAEAPAWVAPVQDAADPRGTRVQERPAIRRSPGPSIPDAPPPPPANTAANRRNLLIAAVAIVVLTAGVAFLLLARGGDGGGQGEEAAAAAAVAVPDATSSDGETVGVVRIDREYELSTPTEGGPMTLTGTISFSSSARGIEPSGPVVEALPPGLLKLSEANVVWSGEEGVPAPKPLGGGRYLYRVDLPAVTTDDPAVVTFTLEGVTLDEETAGDDGEVDARALLDEALVEASEVLATAVSGMNPDGVDTDDYFLLGLTGISVRATSGYLEIGDLVTYEVDALVGQTEVRLASGAGDAAPERSPQLARLGADLVMTFGDCLGGVGTVPGTCEIAATVGDMTDGDSVGVGDAIAELDPGG
ncbi:MAG TPA: protein kinase, partial [Iamia sp.]|nr:protein kinase [Iamia sp.]